MLKSFVPFSEPWWPVSFVTELHLAQTSGGLPTEKSVAGEDAAQVEPVIVMGRGRGGSCLKQTSWDGGCALN